MTCHLLPSPLSPHKCLWPDLVLPCRTHPAFASMGYADLSFAWFWTWFNDFTSLASMKGRDRPSGGVFPRNSDYGWHRQPDCCLSTTAAVATTGLTSWMTALLCSWIHSKFLGDHILSGWFIDICFFQLRLEHFVHLLQFCWMLQSVHFKGTHLPWKRARHSIDTIYFLSLFFIFLHGYPQLLGFIFDILWGFLPGVV